MEKIKITTNNCFKYNYRIDNIIDLEKILKFMYIKDQISYSDIKYKMDYLSKQFNKEKEIFIKFKKLDKPHWRDGRILELYEFDDWKHSKPNEYIEIKDTSLSNLTLIYPINVFKITISTILILLLVIFVIPNLSGDDWAGIIIGSLFFGALASISSNSRY